MPTSDTRLHIPDMRCEGCAKRVTNVLERLEDVRSADVSLDEKGASVIPAGADVDVDDLIAAVEKAGYSPTRG